MENRTAIAELSARLSRQEVVDRLEAITVAKEAVARQRQPDAGVRGAVLRADSGEAMTAPGQERTTVEPRTINWGSSEMCAA